MHHAVHRGHDLEQRASVRRLGLQRGLVRLHGIKHFAEFYRLALLLQPTHDREFVGGSAKSRHSQCLSHYWHTPRIVALIRSKFGTTVCSMIGATGSGTSCAATRLIGASSENK